MTARLDVRLVAQALRQEAALKDAPRLARTIRVLEGWLRRGLAVEAARPPGPIRELHLELTHRCNMRCRMCHHWAMPLADRSAAGRELSLDEIRGLVKGSRLLRGVETVVLTGGEPWLREDLTRIAAFLAGHFPQASLGILSNLSDAGTIRGRLRELRRLGVGRLWLGSSLDGLEQAHDDLRGQRGAFKALLATLDMLRRDFPAVTVSLNFTITPRNHAALWSAYEFALGRGLGFSAQLVVEHEGLKAPETFHWRAAQLAEVERQIDRILLDLHARRGTEGPSWLWPRLLYWSFLKKYARRPRRFFAACPAGSRTAMLSPEGGLFFCPVNKNRLVGEVRAEAFDDLWRSARAESERGFMASGRCHCWLNCVAQPLLESALRECSSSR